MAYDKVVDSAMLDAAMTYTAGRIRNKTGGTDQIAWDSTKGFGDAVDAIAGSDEDAIIQRTISGTYSNDRITTVGACAFLGCQALTAIDLPNVTQVNRNAFESCVRLSTINLPKVTALDRGVFTNSAIQQANFPLVTTIGDNCFYTAKHLISANLPLVTSLPIDSFRLSAIQTADFSAVTNINRTAFTDCTSLEIGDHEDKKEGKVYKNLLYQIRPAFGGNIVATIVNPEHRPQMATVREGVMKKEIVSPAYQGEVIRHDVRSRHRLCGQSNRTPRRKSEEQPERLSDHHCRWLRSRFERKLRPAVQPGKGTSRRSRCKPCRC